MKKFFILCTLFLVMLLTCQSAWASSNLFEDIFNPNKTITTQRVNALLPKTNSLSDANKRQIQSQFDQVKRGLVNYSDSRKKEVYEHAARNLNSLIKNTSSRTEKEVWEYLEYLVKREIDSLSSSANALNRIFGIEEKPCADGYEYRNNTCVKIIDTSAGLNNVVTNITGSNNRFCSVPNGYGYQTWRGSYWSACEVTYCSDGYSVVNNSCVYGYGWGYYPDNHYGNQSRNCSVANGYGIQYWNGYSWWVCQATSCFSGYYISGNSCVYGNGYYGGWYQQTRACNIPNGYGQQYYDGRTWSKCQVTSCYSGYHILGDGCSSGVWGGYYNNQSRNCSVANGYGTQYWNGYNWGTCQVTSCFSGYYISGNSCVYNGYNGGNYGNQTRSCSVANGYGQQYWNGYSWGSCQATSCYSWYYLSGNTCVYNGYGWNNGVGQTRSCNIPNGYGRQTYNGYSWSNCQVTSCVSGYMLSNNSCIRNINDSAGTTRSCYISNGNGTQTYNGYSWSTCIATSCNVGYTLAGGSCSRDSVRVGDTRNCSVSNGQGRQTYNGYSWSTCQVTSCNSGYYPSGNMCLRGNGNVGESRSCNIPNGYGQQYWNGYNWGNCQVTSCVAGYYISGNTCRYSGVSPQ